MARNGDKNPGKLSSLELRSRPQRKWQRMLRAQYLTRPVTIVWFINIITALLVTLIIIHPRQKTVRTVYNQPSRPEEAAIAIRDLSIPQDLEVPDVEGTEKNRQEAAARTKSVYDWDPSVKENILRRVSDLFSGFRDLYPRYSQTENGEYDSPEEQPITVPSAFIQDKEKELLRNFEVPLASGDLDSLKEHGFSPEIENAVKDLIEEVYIGRKGGPASRFVVPSKDLLIKDSGKGIVARRINAPAEEAPQEVTNLGPVLDIAGAQETIDKAAKDKLADLDPKATGVAVKIAKGLIEPNLTFNRKKTEEAKEEAIASVKPLYYKFKKDEVIVRKGDRLSPEMQKKVDAIVAAQTSVVPRSFRSIGLFILVILVISSVTAFSKRNIRKFVLEPKDMVFLSLVLVLSLAVLKGLESVAIAAQSGLTDPPQGLNYYYLVPLAAAAMLVRMVLNSEIALLFALVVSVLGGIVADSSVAFAAYTLVGSAVAAGEVKQCRQRSTILRAGLVLGIVNVLLILVISMANSTLINVNDLLPDVSIMWNALFGLAGGVFAAVVVTGLVPVAESVFSYATDIKLLELLNQDNKLLKQLSMGAPGTHQHSLMVANLAENAAESIGANPLLSRVCAMYHDLGKMNKPGYFAENQWDGNNVHEKLSPSMSTLVIHNHVKEGVELAEKNKLPRIVVDCIRQHHGTSLLKFFYEKAKELSAEGATVEEMDFRYPGPKPQSREAAIVMLSDIVESAARSVRDPSPDRLKGMVQKLINRFFTDGQLDDCDLTLQNLHEIARSFNKTLGAIYHHRPDYPQPVIKGAPAEEKKKKNDQKKAEDNAAGPKDKSEGKKEGKSGEDTEEAENPIKRLGM